MVRYSQQFGSRDQKSNQLTIFCVSKALTIDKGDDFSGPSTSIPQSRGCSRSCVGKHWASGGGYTGQALGSLGGGGRNSFRALGSSIRRGRSVSRRGPPGKGLRLTQHGTGRRDRHDGDGVGVEGNAWKVGAVQKRPMGETDRMAGACEQRRIEI